MRMITEKAIKKFLAHERFSLDNTSVDTSTDRNMSYLRLHGSVIANHNKATGELNITTAGWNTLTTRSRLNGIPGVSVRTQAGQLYLNGVAWSGDWKTV